MSEIEAARGAFESWLRRENGKWADKITERHPDGRYCAMQAYMDWGAWQAAWAWRESELSALRAQRDELLAAAKAYQELSVCYRLNKRPTEKFFDRLETANFAIANAEKDKL